MLSNGRRRFAGDDGAPGGGVAAALYDYAMGQVTEQAALAALSGSRLLVPLVEREASEDESGACGHSHGEHGESEHAQGGGACGHSGGAGAGADGAGAAPPGTAAPGAPALGTAVPGDGSPGAKHMTMPRLIGADGRPAILAFTSLEALVGWRPDARPVPTEAREVWNIATEECCAVVIDVAGPVPLAVEGARLAALAAGETPPAPYADPDVYAQVMAAIADEPGIGGAELAEGPDGTDLAICLFLGPTSQAAGGPGTPATGTPASGGPGTPAPGGPDVPAAVRRAAEAIAARLAPRLRRGIAISAALGPAPAPATGPGPASTPTPGPGSTPGPGAPPSAFAPSSTPRPQSRH